MKYASWLDDALKHKLLVELEIAVIVGFGFTDTTAVCVTVHVPAVPVTELLPTTEYVVVVRDGQSGA